jgi:hypothetical protein
MIDLKGTISVAEAAKRLDKSIEQVRRDLRSGKLKGQRVGNQWFVEEAALVPIHQDRLIPSELLSRIGRRAAIINRRNPDMPDVVEMIRESREDR